MKTPEWKNKAINILAHRCWYNKKICYDKRGAISEKNRRYKQVKLELRAYWCDRCNFWHLTKNINYNKFMSDEIQDPQPEVVITDLPEEGKAVPETAE